jgi:hypothetical protein
LRVTSIIAFLAFAACSGTHAATEWLTITGDPNDPTVNTIEVDPVPIAVNGDGRTLRVRVSRSAQRVSWDGVPYRSYVSEVVFECSKHQARYTSLVFYLQPDWLGEPHKTALYPKTVMRRMQFTDVDPNPTTRIIRAACRTGQVAKATQ